MSSDPRSGIKAQFGGSMKCHGKLKETPPTTGKDLYCGPLRGSRTVRGVGCGENYPFESIDEQRGHGMGSSEERPLQIGEVGL